MGPVETSTILFAVRFQGASVSFRGLLAHFLCMLSNIPVSGWTPVYHPSSAEGILVISRIFSKAAVTLAHRFCAPQPRCPPILPLICELLFLFVKALGGAVI